MAITRNFKEALKNRRTYYNITNQSLVSDKEIEDILGYALNNVPSAFNSQSTRMVLLLGENHKKLWDIVKETLKKIVPEKDFPATEAKIDDSFAAGYGTVLFFEDKSVVKGLQDAFPAYKDNFPIWSEHTAGMHQLAVWTMLEDAGLGASLQHYNPLINSAIAEAWNIDPNWELKSQMPFGVPTKDPGNKEMKPLSERLKIFK